jgi:putative restriction endonuclease
MNLENLKIGQNYYKKEIEEIFDTNFGHSISGINLRNLRDGTKAILLFSSVKGPYSDRSDEDIIYYSGEGMVGDQKLTNANKALVNSNSEGRVIFGFEKTDPKSTEWVYMGLLQVLDYDYIPQNGRKVYEFKIQKLQFENPEIILKEQEELVNEAISSEPVLTQMRDTKQTYRKIKVRSAAFKTKIKELYEDSCAVCGIRRYNKAQNPEVEAAHIYPVEKDGTDDLRNGLSLCKLHHWAFDGGLFVIEDNFEIKVLPEILNDQNYEEIYRFDGKKINLPKNKEIIPNKLYLSEHRKIHNFI